MPLITPIRTFNHPLRRPARQKTLTITTTFTSATVSFLSVNTGQNVRTVTITNSCHHIVTIRPSPSLTTTLQEGLTHGTVPGISIIRTTVSSHLNGTSFRHGLSGPLVKSLRPSFTPRRQRTRVTISLLAVTRLIRHRNISQFITGVSIRNRNVKTIHKLKSTLSRYRTLVIRVATRRIHSKLTHRLIRNHKLRTCCVISQILGPSSQNRFRCRPPFLG